MSKFKVGDKVTYISFNQTEYGIVKGNSIDPSCVFVVYNCAENWDNFMDYTGASTKIKDLIKGW